MYPERGQVYYNNTAEIQQSMSTARPSDITSKYLCRLHDQARIVEDISSKAMDLYFLDQKAKKERRKTVNRNIIASTIMGLAAGALIG